MSTKRSKQATSRWMSGWEGKGTAVEDDRLVFLLATAGIAAHQVQSMLAEPRERNFRLAILALTGLTALSTRFLPRRARGATAITVGLGPLGGAIGGHLLPILRGRAVPPASETAILNLGGGAFLVALGVKLLRAARGSGPES